jgi:hypothetical protein
VVVAEHPASAGQGVLVELAGILMLAQRAQAGGEIVGQVQSGGVVIAHHPAVAAQGVLVEFVGLLMLAQRAQAGGEVVGQAQGDEMIIAQHPAVMGQGVLIDGCFPRSDRRDRVLEVTEAVSGCSVESAWLCPTSSGGSHRGRRGTEVVEAVSRWRRSADSWQTRLAPVVQRSPIGAPQPGVRTSNAQLVTGVQGRDDSLITFPARATRRRGDLNGLDTHPHRTGRASR